MSRSAVEQAVEPLVRVADLLGVERVSSEGIVAAEVVRAGRVKGVRCAIAEGRGKVERLREVAGVMEGVEVYARRILAEVLGEMQGSREEMKGHVQAVRDKMEQYARQVQGLEERIGVGREMEGTLAEKVARLAVLEREIEEMELVIAGHGELACDLKLAEMQLKEKEMELCRLEDEFYNN
jgi:hypothetical protein